MKIISYNLCEGAHATDAALRAFIADEAPDLVCVQEANGWHQNGRAEEFAAATGLPHFVFGASNTPFHLATFSRTPFARSSVLNDGFWHCAVHTAVRYGDGILHVWSLHLDPRDEQSRLAEASHLQRHIGDHDLTLALGDLNSLSAADGYVSDLGERLRAKGISKFGDAELRYDVMRTFSEGGLTDVAHVLGSNEWTVPTPANTDAFHADRLRLDYVLASEQLVPSVRSAVVARNEATDRISDHYPLVVTLAPR